MRERIISDSRLLGITLAFTSGFERRLSSESIGRRFGKNLVGAQRSDGAGVIIRINFVHICRRRSAGDNPDSAAS
jgi:hypothetical protein